MQVQNINSNNYNKNYNSPNFGVMRVSDLTNTWLKVHYNNAPEKLAKLDIWKKELANTEFFNLDVEDACKDLWMIITNIKNRLVIGKEIKTYRNCEAPLYVFRGPEGCKLDVYGCDICDTQDSVWYGLEFASPQEAQNAYTKLNGYKENEKFLGPLDPLEQIQWAVDSVKILEQAFAYMTNQKIVKATAETPKAEDIVSESSKVEKLPFRQRLKNAWLALKG